jgi:hypothetical protein
VFVPVVYSVLPPQAGGNEVPRASANERPRARP